MLQSNDLINVRHRVINAIFAVEVMKTLNLLNYRKRLVTSECFQNVPERFKVGFEYNFETDIIILEEYANIWKWITRFWTLQDLAGKY